MLDLLLASIGTSIVTAFAGWVFFIRKHKAEAVGAEKTNDRTEIENYKLIAQEWREAAQQWKDLCDEYLTKLIENSRKIENMTIELSENKKDLRKFKGLLTKANNRIQMLENKLKNTK
jgi:chromosome segregation ATPase